MHNSMFSNFGSSFGMMPMIGGPQSLQSRDPFRGMMSGGIFGNMERMMQDMQKNTDGVHSYSSSQFISYSNDGVSEPKYYEARSETKQAPGGIRQTRKSEKNSETGLERMAIGHHIHDRGHIIERSNNRRTGDREQKEDFVNMDEEEKDAFHREWHQKARSYSGRDAIADHRERYDRAHQPRAIEDNSYRRERSRANERQSRKYSDFDNI